MQKERPGHQSLGTYPHPHWCQSPHSHDLCHLSPEERPHTFPGTGQGQLSTSGSEEEDRSCLFISSCPFFLLPARQQLRSFLSLWTYLFWTFCVSRIIPRVVFVCDFFTQELLYCWSIPLYGYPHFGYPFSGWTAGWSQVLAFRSSAAVNTHTQVFV